MHMQLSAVTLKSDHMNVRSLHVMWSFEVHCLMFYIRPVDIVELLGLCTPRKGSFCLLQSSIYTSKLWGMWERRHIGKHSRGVVETYAVRHADKHTLIEAYCTQKQTHTQINTKSIHGLMLGRKIYRFEKHIWNYIEKLMRNTFQWNRWLHTAPPYR